MPFNFFFTVSGVRKGAPSVQGFLQKFMSVKEVENAKVKVAMRKKSKLKANKSKQERVVSEDDEPLVNILQQQMQIQQQMQQQMIYQQPLLVFSQQQNQLVQPLQPVSQFHPQVQATQNRSLDRQSLDIRDRKLTRKSTANSEDRLRKAARASQDASSLSKVSSRATLVSRKSMDCRREVAPRSSTSNEQNRSTLVQPDSTSDEDEPLAMKVKGMNALSRKSISERELRPRSISVSRKVPPISTGNSTLRTSKSFDERPSFLTKKQPSNGDFGGDSTPKRKKSLFRRILNVFKTKPTNSQKPLKFEDFKLPEFTSLDSSLNSGDITAKSDYFGDLGFDDIMTKYGSTLEPLESEKAKNMQVRSKSQKREPTPDYDVDPQLAALYSSISF